MSVNKKSDLLTIPNILSLVRLAIIPVMVWLYCGKEQYLATGILLIASGLTDVVDGFIARRFGMISDVGKVLDPLADKCTQGAMLLCLLLRFPLMLLPFIFLIVKEMFMTVSGYIIIKKCKKVLGANWHGKAATVCLYGMMMLHTFWYNIPTLISHITITICAAMITLSFVLYSIRNLCELIHRK